MTRCAMAGLGLQGALKAGDAPQIAYAQVLIARINLVFGDLDGAAAVIDELAKYPHGYSAAWMRLDPMFRPLKGHPRFEATLKRMEG